MDYQVKLESPVYSCDVSTLELILIYKSLIALETSLFRELFVGKVKWLIELYFPI